MPFQNPTLTYHLQNRFWLYSFFGTLAALIAGYLIATLGMIGSVVVVAVPIVLAVVIGILLEPRFGLLVYVQFSFMVNLSRFVPASIPVGLLIDGILVLTMVSLFFNGKRMEWSRLRHPAFYLLTIWTIYTILELANPEAPYRPAWFFRVRAFSLHWFFATIIVLVTPLTRRDILYILLTWLVWSFLAALWAFKQQYIGLTESETIWLNEFGGKTHLLFGHLRSFSFYSDASQFGAEMAGVTLICIIRLFEEKSWIWKAVFAFLGLIYFWGYAVSGTRSALFVLVAGFVFYLLLKRDFVKLAIGGFVGGCVLAVLLFTSVGNGNYQIHRIRTALRPMEDASFLVRLENQQKLANYLKSLPFGAGIGTSGEVGTRFTPYHFAAQIPPDSWFVMLWIETGIVGMWLYILMLMGLIYLGIRQVWSLKDPWLTLIMSSFLAEFVGVAVMGYSNPVMGQFPTSSFIFVSSILFSSCRRWDLPVTEKPKDAASTG